MALRGYTLFRKDRVRKKGVGVRIYFFNMPNISCPVDPSRPNNPSSQLLVDLLINSHFHQYVSQPTRYRVNQTPSTLDLVISSDDNSLTNLEYASLIGISDHIMLKVNL